MSFTDEDLGRLKKWMKKPKFTCGGDGYLAPEPLERIQALLARLEAAEKLIIYRGNYAEEAIAFEEWRKSKGDSA